MTWDPNQGPPNSGPNPYGAPQDPYSAPQNPYGAPQDPYSAPQNPYGAPPQGGPGYPPGYGYAPQGTPLPLGQAIQQLPNQYIRVLTKPSPRTLAEEMGKASWDIVWIQLLIYAVIGAVLGYLATLINGSMLSRSSGVSNVYATYPLIGLGSSLGLIILVPIGFFAGTGILYLMARAFGGQGTFLQQGYTTLLFMVPLGLLTSLLELIPVAGSFIVLAPAIYEIVLTIFATMAVHRLSGGKATAAVLIPFGVLTVLICGCILLFVFVIASAVFNAPHP